MYCIWLYFMVWYFILFYLFMVDVGFVLSIFCLGVWYELLWRIKGGCCWDVCVCDVSVGCWDGEWYFWSVVFIIWGFVFRWVFWYVLWCYFEFFLFFWWVYWFCELMWFKLEGRGREFVLIVGEEIFLFWFFVL